MIYLMQILNKIPLEDLEAFFVLFGDISEHEELGYTPEEYCNDLLDAHFGMKFEDDKQLAAFTKALTKPHLLKSAIGSTRVLREARGA